MDLQSDPIEVSDETESAIREYHKNGASVIRGILDQKWISTMREAIQRVLDHPGSASVEYTPKGEEGRYYGDFFLWRRDPDFEEFMRHSPLPAIAAKVLKSNSIRFFYDQLLVKEPLTKEKTPFHQDLPYWPLKGEDILSIWVPFDRVGLQQGGVRFLKGSHHWKQRYAPTAFGKDSGFAKIYAKMGWEPLPDFEKNDNTYYWLNWETEPGDVILFHPLVIHGSGGNQSSNQRRRALAMRFLGDDVVWDSRPGTFIEKETIQEILPELNLKDGHQLESPCFPLIRTFSIQPETEIMKQNNFQENSIRNSSHE